MPKGENGAYNPIDFFTLFTISSTDSSVSPGTAILILSARVVSTLLGLLAGALTEAITSLIDTGIANSSAANKIASVIVIFSLIYRLLFMPTKIVFLSGEMQFFVKNIDFQKKLCYIIDV